MPTKKAIKIALTEKEEALLHYESYFGKNASVKKHARILYEAGQGAESRTELCKRADAGKAAVNRILEKYTVYGVETVYQCSHGKRRNHLDEIGEELEMYFDENPPESVPDAVQKIKEHFGVVITETPVRIWLKKEISLPEVKKYTRKSKSESTAVFPEQYPASIAGYGSKWTCEGIFL